MKWLKPFKQYKNSRGMNEASHSGREKWFSHAFWLSMMIKVHTIRPCIAYWKQTPLYRVIGFFFVSHLSTDDDGFCMVCCYWLFCYFHSALTFAMVLFFSVVLLFRFHFFFSFSFPLGCTKGSKHFIFTSHRVYVH